MLPVPVFAPARLQSRDGRLDWPVLSSEPVA